MKKLLLLVLCSLTVLSCKKEVDVIDPAAYLSKVEQLDFKYAISRYIDRLPKKASESTKFNSEYDQEYLKRSENADLYFYHKDHNTGEVYFAIAKIAPSIGLKKVVTAGKLKKNDTGEIVAYEEAFRTWKMEVDELRSVSEMLFRKYINHEDLSPFYTKNANGKFIIEFPDENVSYDKEKRTWVSQLADPLQDYYKLKNSTTTDSTKSNP